MQKKGLWVIGVALAIVLATFVYAIFTGTTEGYVRYMNGSISRNANVSVTVSSCSGSGCSGNATTDSNGYYVIANLNLPASGGVSGTARAYNGNGSNSSTADAFGAASLNITVCVPPSAPSLSTQANTHATSVVLSWLSGSDPLGLTTNDTFTYEGSSSTQSSPRNVSSGVAATSNTTRTWSVKTCNALCCSGTTTSTFVAVNDPPATPTQVAVPDTHDRNATFSWTNFTDPDGDVTGNQFQLDSNAIIYNATSPQSGSNLSFANHTWTVRTCDSRGGCSTYASDSFTVGNTAPGRPNLTDHADSDSLTISFLWTSGVDSEGDAIYNEFQVSNDSSFAYILAQNGNASSGITVTNASFFYPVYWRVRTCDSFGSCSAYANDSFVTYMCSSSGGGGSSSSGGGGGGGGSSGEMCECQNECEVGVSYCRGNDRVVCGNFDTDQCSDLSTIECEADQRCFDGLCVPKCEENWLCTDWSACQSNDKGDQTRSCSDANECGLIEGKPDEKRGCEFSGMTEEQQRQAELQKPFELLGVELPGVVFLPVRTVIAPVAIPLMSLGLLAVAGLGLGSLFFKEELEHLFMKGNMMRLSNAVHNKGTSKAYELLMSKVEPSMKSLQGYLKESNPDHRQTMRTYYELKAKVNNALAQTSKETGEHGLANEYTKRAKAFEEQANRLAK